MNKKHLRAALLISVVAVATAACDDGVKPAPPPSLTLTPQVRSILVGESLQVRADLTDPSGSLDAASISWSSLEASIASVNASGLVQGERPGEARIVASVPGAADTMRVEVQQTAASIQIEAVPDLRTGDVVQLEAVVTDTEGEEMDTPVSWLAEPRSLASVDTAGLLTALGAGPILITATAHPATAAVQAAIEPAPPPPGCESASVTLDVGETRAYDGGAPLNLCIAGGARYTLVVANADYGSARTDFRGTDLADVDPGVTPALLPTRSGLRNDPFGPRPDRNFERRLRRQEREQLTPAAARRSLISRSLSPALAQRAVGDLMELGTSSSCDEQDSATGRVEYIGERAIVVADTANPVGMTRAGYERFGVLFDTLLYPVITDHFGEPAGLNGERKITIFFTRAVNELTEEDSRGYVGGYFWAGDLFPRASCGTSNEREMFYMLAADPEGTINSNPRSVEFVLDVSASTIAHELQHLINASRRMYINDADDFETSWLNEGLSHIAEEVIYYRRSGRAPGMDIDIDDLRESQEQVDAANGYAISNHLRHDSYLRDVEAQGPFQVDDDLETRGAIWQFLRYALDRHAGDDRTLLREMVDARSTGFDNLGAAFGMDPTDWFVDDVVAIYADDAVGGIGGRYQHPSWDFRSVLGWINDDGFVIENQPLGDGQVLSLPLESWGTGYVRFAVASGRVGSVRVGTPESPPSENLRMVLLRTQ